MITTEMTTEDLLAKLDAAEAREEYWRNAAYRLVDKLLQIEDARGEESNG